MGEYPSHDRTLTIYDTVAGDDVVANVEKFSPGFEMAGLGYRDMVLEVTVDADDATDSLDINFYARALDTDASPSYVTVPFLTKKTISGTTAELIYVYELPNILVDNLRLGFVSTGATSTWTKVVAKLRRIRYPDSPPAVRDLSPLS
jgi:hypothetical protein